MPKSFIGRHAAVDLVAFGCGWTMGSTEVGIASEDRKIFARGRIRAFDELIEVRGEYPVPLEAGQQEESPRGLEVRKLVPHRRRQRFAAIPRLKDAAYLAEV
jgi:hypothetical protein